MENESLSNFIKKYVYFFLVSEKIFIVNFYNIQNTRVRIIVFDIIYIHIL